MTWVLLSRRSSARLVVAAVAVLARAGDAAAQPSWTRVDSAGPPARIIPALTFDGTRGVTVLFGGDRMRSTPIGDTWEWDGARWRSFEGEAPRARYGQVMAHDTERGLTILFGGYDKADTLFGDTWAWNGTTWRLLASDGPEPRRNGGFAYDPDRKRIVLHGGYAGRPRRDDRFVTDTWEWDGVRWTRAATSGPEPRYGQAMIYDAARRRMLLFGGNDHSGHIYGDTWTWDGRAWTKISESGPPPRGGAQLAWDAGTRSVLLFGGFARDTTYDDVWRWDGARWAKVEGAAVPALIFPMMAHDTRRDRLVLVGQRVPGQASVETWERALRDE